MDLTEIQVSDILSTFYKLNVNVTKVVRIQAGWENKNYKIETDDKPIFLKEIVLKSESELALVLQTLSKLKENNFPTVYPYETTNGSTYCMYQGKKILVYDFLDGTCPDKMTTKMTQQVGSALAILHTLPKLTGEVPKYIFAIDNSKLFLETNKEVIPKDLVEYIDAEIKFIENSLLGKEFPIGIIHGDLFLDNTMFNGENLAAIIDFEDITQMEVILDIAMTILGCCYVDSEFQQELYESFIKGYNMNRQMSTLECENLSIYMRYAILGVMVWRYRKWNLDPEAPLTLKQRYLIMKTALDKFDLKWFH